MRYLLTKALLALSLLLAVAWAPVQAEEDEEGPIGTDEVLLANGSRIIGLVTEVREGSVTVETDFAGTLSIPLEQVTSLTTVDPVIVQMQDESVLPEQPLQVSGEEMLVTDVTGTEQSIPVSELLVVNPEPWEMGQGYKWSGLINFAFAVERGNSDTDELDYKLETVWRSDDDRYTFKMNGELDEANDVKNADNWTIHAKYDYFFDGPTYWGVNAFAEQDEFADLDLRYFIGPYIGKEFFTDPLFTFSAEAGVSYVNEDFITAPDQEYPGANWAFHMSSDYLGGDSKLYFDQLGVWNLDETSDYIVNTTIGLGFPLLWGIMLGQFLAKVGGGAVWSLVIEGVRKWRIQPA